MTSTQPIDAASGKPSYGGAAPTVIDVADLRKSMPLTYLGDALRQVMVGGGTYARLPVHLLVLAGWLAVCFLLSARYFRWQ